jgi:hypothetical protein
MQHRALIAAVCLCAAGPATAEDDGEEFLMLMRQPVAREVAQKHIDNAANKWDGSVFCTPVENREDARFDAVRQYLEAHPHDLWRPQRYLIIQALRVSFPCKPAGT